MFCRLSPNKPKVSSWPPPDRPQRGRGRGSSRGRISNSSGRGCEFRSPHHRPWGSQRHTFAPAHRFPPCFVPPNSTVPPVPYVFPPQRYPASFPPPPGLAPPRFIAPPVSMQNMTSAQSVPMSPRFVGFPGMPRPDTSVPPPSMSPDVGASCPSSSASPQPWTFGMLPPFPPPFPPPPVAGALSNCWNRTPPPPFTPPTPRTNLNRFDHF